MIRDKGVHLSLAIALISGISACTPYRSGHGQKVELDTTVEFIDDENTPIRNARVYIVEYFSFEAPPTITATTMTDDAGVVRLKGLYCAPVEIATDDGGLVIQPDNTLPSYIAVVRKNQRPSLSATYGEPREGAAKYKLERLRQDCR